MEFSFSDFLFVLGPLLSIRCGIVIQVTLYIFLLNLDLVI